MSMPKSLNSYINKYTYVIGFYGLAASCIHNGLMRRPMLSGVHRHVLYTLFGGALGSFVGVVERNRFGQRDFYVDDYIERHPEDFQQAPPKKMGEKYEIWMPTQ